MVVWLSRKLAGAMVDAGAASKENREVYEYGLEILLSTAASVVCVLLAGAVLGKLLETLAFLVVFIALRSVAGGFHAATHLRCFLLTMAAYAASIALGFAMPVAHAGWVAIAVATAALILVAMLAPAPHENRPAGATELRRFRVMSLLIAAVEAVAVVILALSGLAAAALAAAMGMAASAISLAASHLMGGMG